MSKAADKLRSERNRGKPFFSIVIPTRNRARFARLSVAHILSQDFTDFELVVLDNSGERELTTAEFGDERCSVAPTASVLSMRDNWERLFEVASGKYVILLSDKDMLIPGALRRIAAAIVAVDADMLNYRKAAFAVTGAFQTFVQRCSGCLVEGDGSAVLDAWFTQVSHFHDAPMIYNSAVRRELLEELKGVNGRFFMGTSPDVASGLVLLARLGKYHLLDRPLVVSWYGDWSIGMASTLGAHGAAASFFAEYRDDPIRTAGLVPGISGSITETILHCKRAFPDLFRPYQLRWSAYLRNVLAELTGREQAGVDASDERRFLLDVRGKAYSWTVTRKESLRNRWERANLASRVRGKLERSIRRRVKDAHQQPPPSSTTPESGWPNPAFVREELERYFATGVGRMHGFRAVSYFSLPWAKTVEEVEAFATEVNKRLDGLAEDLVDLPTGSGIAKTKAYASPS